MDKTDKGLTTRTRIVIATLALTVADLATTLAGIEAGLFYEANGLMALALNHGVWTFALVKLGLTSVWAGTMIKIRRKYLKWVNGAIMLGYGAVVTRSLWFLLAGVL